MDFTYRKKHSKLFIIILIAALIYNFSYILHFINYINKNYFNYSSTSYGFLLTLTFIITFFITFTPYISLRQIFVNSKNFSNNSNLGFVLTFVIYSLTFLIATFVSDAIIKWSANLLKLHKLEFNLTLIFTYLTFVSLVYVFIEKFILKNFLVFKNKILDYSNEAKNKSINIQKGEKGEKNVKFKLSYLENYKKSKFKVINNKIFKDNNLTAQIDHVVISSKGLFLLETKNYSNDIKITKDNK